jgi:hypothetical protein
MRSSGLSARGFLGGGDGEDMAESSLTHSKHDKFIVLVKRMSRPNALPAEIGMVGVSYEKPRLHLNRSTAERYVYTCRA